jgi:hypothetical protein
MKIVVSTFVKSNTIYLADSYIALILSEWSRISHTNTQAEQIKHDIVFKTKQKIDNNIARYHTTFC